MAVTRDDQWTQAPGGEQVERSGRTGRTGRRMMGNEPGATSAKRSGLLITIVTVTVVFTFLAHQIITGAWKPLRPDKEHVSRPDRVSGSDLEIPDGLLIDTSMPQVMTVTEPAPVIAPAALPVSDEDLERLARLRREQLLSALTASSSVDVPNTAAPTGTTTPTQTAAAGQTGAVLPGSQLSSDYLAYGRTPALSVYEIKAGSVIPAAMLTGINSDLAGEIVAQTTEPVYDTVRGQYVLLPSGSRLIGLYNNEINFGQERVQIVWNRVVFPDGSSLRLDGMNGTDAMGRSGVTGDVNNHWGKIFGAAVLTTLFSVGYELLTDSDRNASAEEDAISSAVGNNVFNTASQITQRNLDIAPTIDVAPGSLINVLVNKDMLFPGPYTATR